MHVWSQLWWMTDGPFTPDAVLHTLCCIRSEQTLRLFKSKNFVMLHACAVVPSVAWPFIRGALSSASVPFFSAEVMSLHTHVQITSSSDPWINASALNVILHCWCLGKTPLCEKYSWPVLRHNESAFSRFSRCQPFPSCIFVNFFQLKFCTAVHLKMRSTSDRSYLYSHIAIFHVFLGKCKNWLDDCT